MERLTDGLNRTNRAIQSSAEIINILGHRADDIGKIIEVIDDLAEQTNLLALNAAIERRAPANMARVCGRSRRSPQAAESPRNPPRKSPT